MTEKRERHFLEAFAENSEALLDLAVDNEAVKAVPVVGTLFKLLKGYQDLSSRILAGKLQKFLSEPSLRNALEARKLRQQILQNPEEAQEIGELLFLTLDKVTDMTKPTLLAKAYASYLIDEIDRFTFEAITHVLNISFLRDVQAFLASPNPPNDTLWKERLTSVGLLEVESETYDGDVIYQETPLGAAFLHAVRDVI